MRPISVTRRSTRRSMRPIWLGVSVGLVIALILKHVQIPPSPYSRHQRQKREIGNGDILKIAPSEFPISPSGGAGGDYDIQHIRKYRKRAQNHKTWLHMFNWRKPVYYVDKNGIRREWSQMCICNMYPTPIPDVSASAFPDDIHRLFLAICVHFGNDSFMSCPHRTSVRNSPRPIQFRRAQK